MHIPLPDRHNAANYFCPQAFLSDQSFPSLFMLSSSAVIHFFFYKVVGKVV